MRADHLRVVYCEIWYRREDGMNFLTLNYFIIYVIMGRCKTKMMLSASYIHISTFFTLNTVNSLFFFSLDSINGFILKGKIEEILIP